MHRIQERLLSGACSGAFWRLYMYIGRMQCVSGENWTLKIPRPTYFMSYTQLAYRTILRTFRFLCSSSQLLQTDLIMAFNSENVGPIFFANRTMYYVLPTSSVLPCLYSYSPQVYGTHTALVARSVWPILWFLGCGRRRSDGRRRCAVHASKQYSYLPAHLLMAAWMVLHIGIHRCSPPRDGTATATATRNPAGTRLRPGLLLYAGRPLQCSHPLLTLYYTTRLQYIVLHCRCQNHLAN